jgi:mannose-1-phosphate guanylyltransferase
VNKVDNPKNEHYYAVIMAGGGGTRLWPLSRKARPKQMLRLLEERSLFQTSVERLLGLFPYERIFVVTIQEQAAELQEQCASIPKENFIIEPMPRGTASVIGLAAVALQQRDPQAVMAVLTSDHFIGNEESFRHVLGAARRGIGLLPGKSGIPRPALQRKAQRRAGPGVAAAWRSHLEFRDVRLEMQPHPG